MSKSKGNVVDPREECSLFGVEPVRYYLLKEGYLHHDGGMIFNMIATLITIDVILQIILWIDWPVW